MSGRASEVRVELLGPLTVLRGTEELDIGWPKQRAVLAVLALRSGQVVSRDELIDAVWGENSHSSAASDVYKYISQLRRLFEPELVRRASATVLTTCVGGYSLKVEPDSVDALVFDDRLRRAYESRAAGDHAATAAVLGQALKLWHGPGAPLAGVPGPFAEIERARLAELRLTAIEYRGAALLELGWHDKIIADHSRLVCEHPMREQLWVNLILALYRSGRIAEALARFREVRQLLVTQLGIEPGVELRTLNERILTGDPALAVPERAESAVASAGTAVPRPAQLPRSVPGFTGRARTLRQLDAYLAEHASPGGGACNPAVVIALDGMAGVGKTALAVQWAYRVADRFPGGQLYLDLCGRNPDQVPLGPGAVLGRFLRSLGVAPDSIPPDMDERAALYRSLLAGRRMLILLDNAASTRQIGPLLPGNGDCVVVVTSRRRLSRLVHEHGAHRLGIGVLERQESLELLRGLLGAERLDAEPDAVEQLCRLCGDLPLALRIAAANLAGQPRIALSAAVDALSADDRLSTTAVDEEGFGRCAVRSNCPSGSSWTARPSMPPTSSRWRRWTPGTPPRPPRNSIGWPRRA
ncbi:MAG TPA: BTAD domain-containing putative transcriptional regulator [Actinocrinis sp.]|uniref:AfsR/SARP family transcriptional regulator n=1 Tax=Actinocrinis sp. TaxID=1920516 RepID=UPI002DDD4535|nr:BTAD domain-containing putative transcriptional regulator [Actinocrinis sp.]HEV2344617.1 BTAD domain-containing putative transcriptional regulator [Actinocrinis sp.]